MEDQTSRKRRTKKMPEPRVKRGQWTKPRPRFDGLRNRNKNGQWRKKRSKNGERRPPCSVGCEPFKEYGKKGCEGCIDGRRNKIVQKEGD